jgi:hypothetical protein
MYTTEQFEKALLEQGVSIDNISAPKGIVKDAAGFVGKIGLMWNHEGKCSYCGIIVPAYNLDLDPCE